jgi:hypothetical protein
LIAAFEKVGEPLFEILTAEVPLFLHVPIVEPFVGKAPFANGSAPSNHKTQLEICVGAKIGYCDKVLLELISFSYGKKDKL